jgi:hypothetical protein
MINPFYLVILDRNQEIFNVLGPMSDDRPWNDRVYSAQEGNRDVICFTPPLRAREQIVESVRDEFAYAFSDETLV